MYQNKTIAKSSSLEIIAEKLSPFKTSFGYFSSTDFELNFHVEKFCQVIFSKIEFLQCEFFNIKSDQSSFFLNADF